jgi:hypothetical protein
MSRFGDKEPTVHGILKYYHIHTNAYKEKGNQDLIDSLTRDLEEIKDVPGWAAEDGPTATLMKFVAENPIATKSGKDLDAHRVNLLSLFDAAGEEATDPALGGTRRRRRTRVRPRGGRRVSRRRKLTRRTR